MIKVFSWEVVDKLKIKKGKCNSLSSIKKKTGKEMMFQQQVRAKNAPAINKKDLK